MQLFFKIIVIFLQGMSVAQLIPVPQIRGYP